MNGFFFGVIGVNNNNNHLLRKMFSVTIHLPFKVW